MWWNQAARRWEKHPDCLCDHDPCHCAWLRPLDNHGRPIPHELIDGVRYALERRARLAAQQAHEKEIA